MLNSIIENPAPRCRPYKIAVSRKRAQVDDVGRAVGEAEVDRLRLNHSGTGRHEEDRSEKLCCGKLAQGAPPCHLWLMLNNLARITGKGSLEDDLIGHSQCGDRRERTSTADGQFKSS